MNPNTNTSASFRGRMPIPVFMPDAVEDEVVVSAAGSQPETQIPLGVNPSLPETPTSQGGSLETMPETTGSDLESGTTGSGSAMPPEEPPRKNRYSSVYSSHNRAITVAIVLAVLLLGTGIFALLWSASHNKAKTPAPSTKTVIINNPSTQQLTINSQLRVVPMAEVGSLKVDNSATIGGDLTVGGNLTATNISGNFTGTYSGNGSGLQDLNASNITSGTLSDARLSANVTLQGNTFNGANQLVQLNGSGALPALNAINLTSLNASNISTGTVADARLSSNVALKDADNVFTGQNSFTDLTTMAALNLQGNLTLSAGSTISDDSTNGITFSFGGRNYLLPNHGVANQTICTTDFPCAQGAGSAVILAPGAAQDNASGTSAIFINNSAGGDLLQLQGNGSDVFVVDSSGNTAIDGSVTAASFSGNGSGLTSVNAATLGGQPGSFYLDASNINTGTLADARLSANVALLNGNNNFTGVLQHNGNNVCDTSGNCAGVGGGVTTAGGTAGTLPVFTGSQSIGDSLVSQSGGLVSINGGLSVTGTATASSFSGNGAAVTNVDAVTLQGHAASFFTNASNITAGTLADARLTTNVTLQGNTFNGVNQLVQLNGSGALPALNGANLTSLNASNISSGTLNDLRLSGNVALLNASANFTGASLQHNGNDVCDTSGNCVAAGAAGGDLTGSYPNPTIAKLQGVPFSITSLTSGQILQYDGTNWINQTVSGDVTISNTGVTTIGNGVVTNAKLQNSSLTVTAGNGLSGGGSVSLGSSTSLNVVYGSAANTAAQGNTTLVCPTGTGNLTGGGNTITLGTGGSCNNLTVVNSPVFSGTLGVQGSGGITVGVAGTTTGVVNFANSSNSQLSVLQSLAPTGSGNVTYQFPSGVGGTTYTLCTDVGNCAGTGGGITGSGTSGTIAKFNGAGTITDSTLSESGTTLTASGNVVIQGSSSLALGTANANDGSITFYDAAGSHTVTLQAPATDPASNLVFKLPSADGSNGDCLETDSSGNLSFQPCTGGAGGGVTSLNSQTGIVNLANATGASGTVTINNASTSQKGIAQFNATNFSDNGSGTINTIQDIATTSSPSFAGLTLNGTSATTLDTVQSALSIQLPTGNDYLNGITIKAPSTTWGPIEGDPLNQYGKGQFIEFLREGTPAVAPDDSVLFRVDSTGGVGTAGGLHVATGLRQDPGYNVSQAVWINPQIDTVGLVITGSSGQTKPLLVLQDAGGAIAKVTAAGEYLGVAGSATNPSLSFLNDTNTGIYNSAADTLDLVTGGTSRVQINSSGQLGIGTPGTIGYQLDLRNTTSSQIHLASNSSDNAGYLAAISGGTFALQNNVAYNGANYVAKAGTASQIAQFAGGLFFQSDTGLTIGNTYAPTTRFSVTSAGNGTFTGTLAVQGANSLTLGTTGTNTGAILFKGSTGASGTITLIGPNNPSNNTLTLPNETGTLCSTGSVCSGYQSPLTFNNGLTNTAGTVQLGGSFIQNTSLAAGNSFGLTLTSDLSGGARSTYPLSITQASNATNNNSVGLLQLTNNDTGSTAALLSVTQNTVGTSISINGTPGSSGATIGLSVSDAIYSTSTARGIVIGPNSSSVSGTALYIGSDFGAGAIGINIPTVSSGTGISVGNTYGTATSLNVVAQNSALGYTHSGNLINIGTTSTAQLTSSDSGHSLNISRSNTVNGSSQTLTVTGSVANLQSNCTQTVGTCTDSSNILSLNQQYANATGAVALIQNSGTGNALQIQDGSGNVNALFNNVGNQLTLGRIAASGTVTQGKLVVSDGTTDNFGLTLQATTLTANRTITFPNETGTVCTTGSVCTGYQGALTFNNGLNNTAGTVQLGGTLLQNTAIDAGSSFRLILTSSLNSGARSSYPLVISQANNATNDNSTGLLQLSNSDTGSTAPILNINQVTNGSGISITGLNSGTAIDAGSIDSGTGLDLGSLSSGSGINISGSQLTSGVGLKVNNGVGVTSASAVSVIGSASGSLSSYTGKWLNITPTRTNTATSGTLTDSGNFLNLTRSNTQNGAGGTFAITGALANLQSNCTQTAGTCNDSSNILNLNQQYANASGAVLNIQAAGSGAAINITGQTTSKALVTSTTSGTALDLGSVDTGTAISASGISTGTGLSVLNFISGTGIKLGGANLTTGTGILFNTTSAGITTGSILTATGNASANLASYSGSLINIAPTRTQTGAAVVTDSGSFLKLARANTVNNVAGTFAITGALANLQSNCTQTAGTCTDSSNILNLNQQYASATGAVANIQNAGTGNALQIQDGSSNVNAAFNNLGNQLTLGRVASSGTITQGKLVFADGTTDNFGLTLQATTLTANRTITFPNETGTVCTTGSVCTGYQGALTFNNGLNNTAGTVQLGGSFIQNTTLATGNSFGLSLTSDLSGGARGTYPLSITQANDATNNNTAGLLNLTNSDTGSTGPVLAVSQSANGSAASFVSNGTALLVQGGSSSRAIDITAPGGSGTAVYVNGASAITSGNGISISDAGSGGPAFTGHYINVSPSRTNTATSGTRTDTGNFLNLARSNTQNGAGGTYAITGALANLQSNCTQTAGTCTDTSNILNLNQQYANATGAVALIQNSGTGNALQIQDGSGNVNAAFNNVGNQLTLGRIASSGTVTQGKLVLSDGTTDNFGGTLQTTTLTANRTYTLPDATGTVCIIGSTSCSAAGTGYIQNGTTVQTNANFAIQSAAAGSVGGVIKGATSQTADLFQLQDSTGANLQRVDASGNLETIGYYDNGIGGIGLFGNLLTFSEQFDNAAWTMTNVTAPTADTVVAPDGQTTAESLADSASGGSVSQTSGTAPTNANYTFSLWLKTASGTQNTDLRIDGATSGTGTKVTVPVTTTWQRFSVTQNTNGFTGNIKVDIFPGGTGGSGTVSAWGAQLVLASNPEVYARTTTSTVAASAGVVSNGGLFVSSMNAGDKPLIVQGAPSQSGDLLQLQNSSGTVLSSFASNGNLTVPNVTVASQGTISFVGGTTGQRPGSPTAGQLYFDTSTNQLIQYNGSKWVSDHTTATKIVAASNSSQAEKDAADYVATGSGDQATINTALTAASGGSVYLMEGTYTISAAISIPNNTTLAGADAGTIITLPNAQNGTYNMITNTDTSTGTGVTIQNLKLDGNKANQTSGSMKGIYLQGMGAGSGGSARRGAIIQKIVVQNIYDISGAGINIHGSSNNVVDNVTVMNEDGSGVFVDAFSANNKITGITAQGNGFYGISLIQASNNVVTNNISQGNSRGIDLVTSSGNVISDNNVLSNVAYGIAVSVSSNNNIVDSNVVQSSALQGIRLNSVSNNAITGNSIYDSGGASNNNGILLTGSSSNNISDNFVTDTGCSSNCYAINVSDSATTGTYISDNTYSGDGTHTATINDAGTGTIYANQADASGNLIIKSQGGGLAVGQSSASASLSLQGALVTTQLPTPTLSATVTNVGTSGATTYRYQVTALDGNSGETAGSTVQQTTTGNATLSGTNYNTITWTPVGGAVQYSVYRCTGAACTPLKLTTVSGNVTSYNDQAAGSPSGTAPGSNNTGGGSFGGNVSVQGVTTVSSSGVRVAGQANFASSSGNYSILVSGIQNRVLVIDNASFAGTQIVTNLTNQVVAAVRGAAGQTADLLQLQDSSSNPLSSFSATGQLRVGATYAAMTVPSSLASSPIAGGALTAGAYKYEVTAIDSAGGETTVSNEVTGTTAGGNLTNSLTWTAVTGASGYKVYRTASGGGTGTENYLTTVLTNSYKDTGAITLGSTTPPSTNTAYVSTNVSMSNIQLSIGGNGTPTGQVYVSGTVPASATGTIATAANPYAVSVQGRYAYVVSQNGNKIEVFDVSNPVNPVKTGSVTTSGNVGARSINVQGKYAYVGLESNTVFQILDISNPSNPTSVGTFPSSNNITVNDNQAVYVQGRYAYIVARNGSLSVSNLQIYDISNPVSPVQVSNNMQFGGFGGGIYVKDNIAYVNTVSNGTLYAIDVTNPYSPSQLGSLSALSSNGNGDIYVQGRYAYLNLGNGLSVIDVSNPASMKRVQNVTTAGTARSLTVSGRYAFVTGSTNLLQVFDISNPSGVGSVGSVSTDTNPFNVAVSGRYAYVVNSTSNTLQIFDMGGTYTQQLEAGGAELGALQVDGNAQVVGDTNIQGGLSVGQSIQTAGNLGVSGNAQVQGTLGIVGGIQGGLTINGISTPASPTVTTNGTTGAQTWGYKVVAINAAGGSTPASAQGTTTSGNGVSTLTSSNYQAISWTPVAGAVSYKVYRTQVAGTSPSPATTGLIGTTSSTFLYDTGLAGDGTTASSTDTSGSLTMNGPATFNENNLNQVSIVSDLSGGARSSYLLNLTQANNASNDSSVGLVQLTNSDNGSTAALLQLTQVSNGTGVSVTGNDAGVGYSIGGTTTGASVQINSANLTSGKAIDIQGGISGGITPFTGTLISANYSRTNSASSGIKTDTGNFLSLVRSNAQNVAGGTFAITGALANLQSNCTQTAGTCTDSANILSLNQQYANASGAVAVLKNAGTGDALDLQNGTSGVLSKFNSNGDLIIGGTSSAASANAFQVQDTSGVAFLTANSSTSTLTVKNVVITASLTVNGHIISGNSSGTTTIAAGAAACTTPTVSVTGNDTSGMITVTTGTGCAASGILATVTFANAYGAAPNIVLTPAEANAAALQYYINSATISTTTFDLDTPQTPASTTTYKFYYHIMQ